MKSITQKTCTVKECTKAARAKNLCRSHYKFLMKYGSVTPPVRDLKKDTDCIAYGCKGKRGYASGLCPKHEYRRKKYADPTFMSPTMKKRQMMISTTPEYNSWRMMKSRCYDENSKKYKACGALGITVCDRWKNSAVKFIQDMGKQPSPEHVLMRIDPRGNYEPSNCKWATPKEKSNNMLTTKYATVNGETKTLREWATVVGIHPTSMAKRIRKWPEELWLVDPGTKYADRCFSYGAVDISKWLKSNKIEFTIEKTFSSLKPRDSKHGNFLPAFDFCVPAHRLLIEFDGEQHFKPVKYFGGDKKFEQTIFYDQLKNRWAKDHGWELLRIPYTQAQDIDNILSQHFIDKLSI